MNESEKLLDATRALAADVLLPSGWAVTVDIPRYVNVRDARGRLAVAYKLPGRGGWWWETTNYGTLQNAVDAIVEKGWP